jgi:hypothetical protein
MKEILSDYIQEKEKNSIFKAAIFSPHNQKPFRRIKGGE